MNTKMDATFVTTTTSIVLYFFYIFITAISVLLSSKMYSLRKSILSGHCCLFIFVINGELDFSLSIPFLHIFFLYLQVNHQPMRTDRAECSYPVVDMGHPQEPDAYTTRRLQQEVCFIKIQWLWSHI